jgi:hypothetical protein
MKAISIFCCYFFCIFFALEISAKEVVLIELEKKTEQALGFYPWDQERQIKLINIILKREPKALLSLLPKLEIDSLAKDLLNSNPTLFLRGTGMKGEKRVGEFKHQAEEVLLYDTTKNYQNILFSLIDYLGLAAAEKNVSWTYKGNMSLGNYKKISALDFFTLEELPDLKNKVVILAYHGRNLVKEKGVSNYYSHPGNVAAVVLVELLSNGPTSKPK